MITCCTISSDIVYSYSQNHHLYTKLLTESINYHILIWTGILLTATGWKLLGWHHLLSSTCSPCSPTSAYAQNWNMQSKLIIYIPFKLPSRLPGYWLQMHADTSIVVVVSLFFSPPLPEVETSSVIRVWGQAMLYTASIPSSSSQTCGNQRLLWLG